MSTDAARRADPSRAPGWPDRIEVVEVGPRDGFQMERELLPRALKIETIERLSRSGLREIEAVSFVSPRVIPQMQDAAEVMAGVHREPGVRYWALVPNVRGAERALASGMDGIHLVIAVTETFNLENVGLSISESMAELQRIVRLVDGAVPVAVALAVAFGCPFEGRPDDARLATCARAAVDAGAAELVLADTAGLGHPRLVRRVLETLRERCSEVPLRLHLHDTRGLGMANAVAALELGVTRFDTALGGLGGCPIMRGASGNLATEDFVNLCNELGIATGVELDEVRAASRAVEEFLGRHLPSRILASGTRAELMARNRA